MEEIKGGSEAPRGELSSRRLEVSPQTGAREPKTHSTHGDGTLFSNNWNRVLGIVVWYLGLLAWITWFNWSKDADGSVAYKFAAAVGQLTTAPNLILSLFVVGAILLISRDKSRTADSWPSWKKFIRHPGFHSVSVVFGVPIVLTGLLIVIATAHRENRTTQLETQPSPINPNALDDYELMSKSETSPDTETDGISAQTKKRMREMFALELSGAMQKQNNPLRVAVVGENHEVLSLQWSGMTDAGSDQLLQYFRESDANFWNGMRLMNFRQLILSGNNFKKIVTRQEIVANSRNYEKYKAEFLKRLQEMQTGAKGEMTKP